MINKVKDKKILTIVIIILLLISIIFTVTMFFPKNPRAAKIKDTNKLLEKINIDLNSLPKNDE